MTLIAVINRVRIKASGRGNGLMWCAGEPFIKINTRTENIALANTPRRATSAGWLAR